MIEELYEKAPYSPVWSWTPRHDIVARAFLTGQSITVWTDKDKDAVAKAATQLGILLDIHVDRKNAPRGVAVIGHTGVKEKSGT